MWSEKLEKTFSKEFSLGFAVAALTIASSLLTVADAKADMSVNGFFPADYVRTDVFASNASQSGSSGFSPLSLQQAREAQARVQKKKPTPLRMRSGRFSKTTRGTHRSGVQQSEWDVGPLVPTK